MTDEPTGQTGQATAFWYIGQMVQNVPAAIERVQTGVRIERRMLKVLKGLAEYHDLALGDLLEGIVLHAFEGKTPFGEATLERVRQLCAVYDLDLGAAHSHPFIERPNEA